MAGPASTSALTRHPEQTSGGLRFSAKGLASEHVRLGLSAGDCGLLLGASGQSVYNWEAGKTRPSDKHLPAIVGIGFSKLCVEKQNSVSTTTTLQSIWLWNSVSTLDC